MKKNDNVTHPVHYAESCSLECIQAMQLAYGTEAVYNFCKCNAFKYMWRYKNKNGEEDLKKARWYINYASNLAATNEEVNLLSDMMDIMKQCLRDLDKTSQSY